MLSPYFKRRYLMATHLLRTCDIFASHSSAFLTPISEDDPAMTGSAFDSGATRSWCSVITWSIIQQM